MASAITRSASAEVTLGQAFAASKNYNTSLLKKFIRQQLQMYAQNELVRLSDARNARDPDVKLYSTLSTQEEKDGMVQRLAKQAVSRLLSLPDEEHEPEKRATLLHWASYSGSLESMQLLMAFGADINAQETDGKTPLHWAAFEGHEDICRYLLNNPKELKPFGTVVDPLLLSEDVNGDRVHTPCHLAVINHHMAVAELFPNYLDVISKNNKPTFPVEIIVEANARPEVEHELTRIPEASPPPPKRATSEMGVATSPIPSRSPSSSSGNTDREERELRRRRREEKREKKRRRQKEKEELLKQLIMAINAASLAKEQLQQQAIASPPPPPQFIPATPIRIRWVPEPTDAGDPLLVIPTRSLVGGREGEEGAPSVGVSHHSKSRRSTSPTTNAKRRSASRSNGYFLRTTSPTSTNGRPPWRPPANVRIDADVRVVGHGPLATENQIALSQARAGQRTISSPTAFLRSETQAFE